MRQYDTPDSWYRYSHNSAISPRIIVANRIATSIFAALNHKAQFTRYIHDHEQRDRQSV